MDWSCDGTQACVPLTLKDVKSHIRSQRWKKKKDDLLPVSEDCLQQGTKTQKRKRRRRKKVFCAAKISFNIVAHSGLIEEAFSGHCYGTLQLGLFLLHSFCFSTHSLLFFFKCVRVPTCTPLFY